MEKKITAGSYIYMIIAFIGILILALGLLEYIVLVGSTATSGFLLTFGGFLIVTQYIFHLEKMRGISNKVIWIKSGLLAFSLFLFAIAFYW